MGESSYNPMLPGIVADLKAKGPRLKSEGATRFSCIEFKNKEGDPMGVIIQKKDGGYLYTTTDNAWRQIPLRNAARRPRFTTLTPSAIQHLMQASTIVRKPVTGRIPVPLEHHYGSA